uniref:Uncharacterized protein n=1 Tax=Arundo donax TaxID=35708 RepID=A0A0A9AWI6_ARUDO
MESCTAHTKELLLTLDTCRNATAIVISSMPVPRLCLHSEMMKTKQSFSFDVRFLPFAHGLVPKGKVRASKDEYLRQINSYFLERACIKPLFFNFLYAFMGFV